MMNARWRWRGADRMPRTFPDSGALCNTNNWPCAGCCAFLQLDMHAHAPGALWPRPPAPIRHQFHSIEYVEVLKRLACGHSFHLFEIVHHTIALPTTLVGMCVSLRLVFRISCTADWNESIIDERLKK